MKLRFVSAKDVILMSKTKDAFVFGGGNFGHAIANFLKVHGINFKAYVIDDKYCEKNKSENVISVSELLKRPEMSYELFYAVGSVDRMKLFLQENWRREALVIWDPWQVTTSDAAYILDHKTSYEQTLLLWEDELSRKTQLDFLEAWQTGLGYKDMENLQQGTYFNSLSAGLKDMEGGFVDCGAYTGDSVKEYLDFAGEKQQRIWAFEPDRNNFSKLEKNFADRSGMYCINKGVWSSCTRLRFCEDGEESACVSENGSQYIDVTTIDDMCKEHKVACIKMDIEGSELNALKGAEKIIRRDYPMLLISAYHKVEDLIMLPQYIRSVDLGCKYRLYLRHHACTRPELVLYAIPK